MFNRRAISLTVVLLLALTAAASPANAAKRRPKCLGKKATIIGTRKANRIKGTEGNDVIVGLGGNDVINGLGGNDTICGSGGLDTLYGEAGNDAIDLGPGNGEFAVGGPGSDLLRGRSSEYDIASYFQSATSIQADLAAGSVSGEGTDTLVGIRGIEGSPHGDTILGDDFGNWMAGGGGTDTLEGEGGNDELYGFGNPTREDNSDSADFLRGDEGNDYLVGGTGNDNLNGGPDIDRLDGGTGDDTMAGGGQSFDTLDYTVATQSMTVNLGAGVANGMGTDLLTGVTDVWGSQFSDTLVGSDQANEGFIGLQGNDNINGGGGANDAVDYQFDQSGVTVDLATGSATGSFAGSDTLLQIESVQGSNFGDTLAGDDGPNMMFGLAGVDTLTGRLGDDYLDGGPGVDILNGGEGTDTCVAGESLASCEGPVARALRASSRHGADAPAAPPALRSLGR